MKYKTLFRLALKVIGVYLLLNVLLELPWTVWHQWSLLVRQPAPSPVPPINFFTLWQPIGRAVLGIVAGLYLFFGGEWIVNKAIPSNKPYCHECGYLLKNLTGNRCPECGTPFKADSANA